MVHRSSWILFALCLGSCVLPEYETSSEVDQVLAGIGGNSSGGGSTGGDRGVGGEDEPATGGAETGGNRTGGTDTGGAETGGVETGGSRTGGTDTGGVETGGVETGGDPAGGTDTGGGETGGAETGGAETGGTPPATGGTAASGGTVSGTYTDDGTVHGYCFGAEVLGEEEFAWEFGDELCHDYVLPNEAWDQVAFLGCNLNQPIEGGEGTEGLWTPPGPGGICVYGSGFERIQIQGPNSAVDADDRWCAVVPRGVGGCADWQDFNTECWDSGAGLDYAYEPLQGVLALQPSLGSVEDGVIADPLADTLCVTEVRVY